MPPTPGSRYRPFNSQRPLFQGDVLESVPTVGMPTSGDSWLLLRATADSGITVEQALRGKRPRVFKPWPEENLPDAWRFSQELIVAKATKASVILVTQSCDIDWRKHYQVAPVKPLAGLSERKRRSIEAEEIEHSFFLPGNPPLLRDDSYADLTQMTSVHESYFDDARVLCRLSAASRHDFQVTLASFHGRPFGFNVRDTVREAGRYGCVMCFLLGGFQSQHLAEAAPFPPCPGCGQDAKWILIGG